MVNLNNYKIGSLYKVTKETDWQLKHEIKNGQIDLYFPLYPIISKPDDIVLICEKIVNINLNFGPLYRSKYHSYKVLLNSGKLVFMYPYEEAHLKEIV